MNYKKREKVTPSKEKDVSPKEKEKRERKQKKKNIYKERNTNRRIKMYEPYKQGFQKEQDNWQRENIIWDEKLRYKI